MTRVFLILVLLTLIMEVHISILFFYKLIYACLTEIASSIIINYFLFYSIRLEMTGKKSSEIGVSTGLLNRMRKSQIADVRS